MGDDTEKIRLIQKAFEKGMHIPDRRKKSWVTQLSEVAGIIAALGVLGVFIRIGEYKANFQTLCDKVSELKCIIDANAATNTDAHIAIRKDISKTQQAVVAHTG